MRRVTIDGIEFRAQSTQGYVYTRLDGWYSGAPIRGVLEDRPNADGAFGLVRAYRSARPLLFEGAVYADTSEEAIADTWRTISAIQADGEMFDLEVEDDSQTLSVLATMNGTPTVEPLGDSAASVTITMLAPDPVKYGEELTASTGLPTAGGGLEYPLFSPSGALYYGALGGLGRVTLTNEGTAETWPVFQVTGGLTDGFYLQRMDTGDVLRYDRVVPAGTSVSIDSRTGEVLVDGTSDASTYLTRDDFSSVPASGSAEWQFNAISSSSGTPTLTVTYRSGWW